MKKRKIFLDAGCSRELVDMGMVTFESKLKAKNERWDRTHYAEFKPKITLAKEKELMKTLEN